MRTLVGIVIGILLTVGAAYYHDINAKPDPLNPNIADEQIVNWEVAGAVFRNTTNAIGNVWKSVTGGR